MTDEQQRNADIANSVLHALNQAAIDAREWQRQSKQWEAVAVAQRVELATLRAALARLVRAVECVGSGDFGPAMERARELAGKERG